MRHQATASSASGALPRRERDSKSSQNRDVAGCPSRGGQSRGGIQLVTPLPRRPRSCWLRDTLGIRCCSPPLLTQPHSSEGGGHPRGGSRGERGPAAFDVLPRVHPQAQPAGEQGRALSLHSKGVCRSGIGHGRPPGGRYGEGRGHPHRALQSAGGVGQGGNMADRSGVRGGASGGRSHSTTASWVCRSQELAFDA